MSANQSIAPRFYTISFYFEKGVKNVEEHMIVFKNKLPKTLDISISNNSLKFETCMLHKETKELVQKMIDSVDAQFSKNIINFKCNFKENDDYVSLITFIPDNVSIEEQDVTERFSEDLGIKAYVYSLSNGQRLTVSINKEGYKKICQNFLDKNPKITLSSLKEGFMYRLPILELRVKGCILKFKEHLKLCFFCHNIHDDLNSSFCKKTCMSCSEPNHKDHRCVSVPDFCVPCKVYLQKTVVHGKNSTCDHYNNLQKKLDINYRQKYILDLIKDKPVEKEDNAALNVEDFPILSKKKDKMPKESNSSDTSSEMSDVFDFCSPAILSSASSESTENMDNIIPIHEPVLSQGVPNHPLPVIFSTPVLVHRPEIFPQICSVSHDPNNFNVHIPKVYLSQGVEVTVKMRRDGSIVVSHINNVTYA